METASDNHWASRHPGYQIRGWLIVLFGLLITALFSEKTQLKPSAFLIVGLFSLAAFCATELMARRPKRIAINRAIEVEEAIRSNHGFDSPKIAESISNGPKSTIWNMVSEFGIAQV
jgi:hypothetical protein